MAAGGIQREDWQCVAHLSLAELAIIGIQFANPSSIQFLAKSSETF
jgi:hypothetical protein